ncbi:DUF6054 family protein [Clostridium estertheticum]|uniref:DUF6054 family protein n=1 Tax=Clostridium estertheticum TaxID=238834 RepID=UPI0013E90FF5|nr:DUF6054 family protein [Clostridium estertheticum]MBZ9688580.1 DUF6054 family protein [Clostridium estertheticum]
MSKCSFIVSLLPSQVMTMVKSEENSDLVYEEFHDIGDGKYNGTLIFEKYYMRAGNRAALVVLVNNFNGKTIVKSIATGSSQGMLFNFDWGAADSFADSIRRILKGYITEEID